MEFKNFTGACDELTEKNKNVRKSAAGGLHKYANSSLVEQENVWKKAAVKKYVRES